MPKLHERIDEITFDMQPNRILQFRSCRISHFNKSAQGVVNPKQEKVYHADQTKLTPEQKQWVKDQEKRLKDFLKS